MSFEIVRGNPLPPIRLAEKIRGKLCEKIITHLPENQRSELVNHYTALNRYAEERQIATCINYLDPFQYRKPATPDENKRAVEEMLAEFVKMQEEPMPLIRRKTMSLVMAGFVKGF